MYTWWELLRKGTSSIYSPGLNSTGAIIGYGRVTEIFGVDGEGGRKEHFFHNERSSSLYPFVPSQGNSLNGKISLRLTYNSIDTLSKKEEFEYINKETFNLSATKIFSPSLAQGYTHSIFNVQQYDNVSTRTILSSFKEKLYTNGQEILLTSANCG